MIRASKLQIGFRAWAALPAAVVALVTTVDGKIGTIQRPEFPKGVCDHCGCTELDACVDGLGRGCAWRDKKQNRCTSCPPKSADLPLKRAAELRARRN